VNRDTLGTNSSARTPILILPSTKIFCNLFFHCRTQRCFADTKFTKKKQQNTKKSIAPFETLLALTQSSTETNTITATWPSKLDNYTCNVKINDKQTSSFELQNREKALLESRMIFNLLSFLQVFNLLHKKTTQETLPLDE
jgi:hypothetical protein